MHGRKAAPLIAGVIPTAPGGDLDKEDKLMTYKEVDFLAFDHANEGITESAIYVNPGLSADEPTLILKGQYISPTTGAPSAAEYKVPIQRTDEMGNTTYIDLERNNRYKLRIIDVTSSSLKSTFEIEDWINDGGIDVKPTDTKPIFVKFGADNAPTDLVDVANGITANTTFRLVNDATFTMTVKSSAAVNTGITQHGGRMSWISLNKATTEPTTDDGYYLTELTFKTEDLTHSEYPATITLFNKTSPDDPETQTTLTFFAPMGSPLVDNLDPAVASPATNNLAGDINMTNLKNSSISLSVYCPEGVADVTVPNGFSLAIKEDGQTPYSWIYTLRITDPKEAVKVPEADLKLTFKNKEAAAEEDYNIVLTEMVSTISSADARVNVAGDGLSIKLDVAKMNGVDPVVATLHVPAGSAITPPAGEWLSVEGSTTMGTDGFLCRKVLPG